jgi:nucleosome assembly protein 1-like 1
VKVLFTVVVQFVRSMSLTCLLDTKQTRIVKKTVPAESFFNFFNPPIAPAPGHEDEVDEELEERLELDYQLGEDIKEKIIPRAVDWFTGAALMYEGFMGEEDEFDEEDDEDDDEDDSDDENEDEDDSDDDVSK